MSNKDKMQVVLLGIAIGACLTTGLWVYAVNSEPDYYKYMSEHDRQFLRQYMSQKDRSAALNAMWPVIPLFLLCGLGLSYAIWTTATKQGRQYTARRKGQHAGYVQDHREEMNKVKEGVADGCIWCAVLGPCLVPALIIFAALFIGALVFLNGLFTK